MRQNRDTPRQPSPESDPGEGSLNQALDDLESIIGRRDGGAPSTREARDHAPAPPSGGDARYPSARCEATHREDSGARNQASASPLESKAVDISAGARERIAERLANEVEVIVNARLESAVREVLADVHRDVRNHIAIVLPELLDEILSDDESP